MGGGLLNPANSHHHHQTTKQKETILKSKLDKEVVSHPGPPSDGGGHPGCGRKEVENSRGRG